MIVLILVNNDTEGIGSSYFGQWKCSLRNPACTRQFSSYRATFEVEKGKWQHIKVPFNEFKGHGPGAIDTKFDNSTLRRMSIVAIGKPMEVYLGIGKVGFYKEDSN